MLCSILTSPRNAFTGFGAGVAASPGVTATLTGPAPFPFRGRSPAPASPTAPAVRAPTRSGIRARSEPVLAPSCTYPGRDVGRHDRLGRPAAVVALGGRLAGRVDARLATPELLVRRVVEVVDRALGEEQVVRV